MCKLNESKTNKQFILLKETTDQVNQNEHRLPAITLEIVDNCHQSESEQNLNMKDKNSSFCITEDEESPLHKKKQTIFKTKLDMVSVRNYYFFR